MQRTKTKIDQLVAKARKSEDFSELKEFCLSEEYQKLPYAVKNYHFVTASKLKKFNECQLAYKYEHVDLVPKPHGADKKDYFVVGGALDDLLTHGAEYYAQNYVSVDKRVTNIDEEIEVCNAKIKESRKMLKKDGERSKAGMDREQRYMIKKKWLTGMKSKIQMTERMEKEVDQMYREFQAQSLFNQAPRKQVYFAKIGEFILKAELDDETDEYINDIKSTANILTFSPEMYEIQAAFYFWLVEEVTGKKKPVRLEVVDKHSDFSRSKVVEYTLQTLEANKHSLVRLLVELQEATESGIYMQTTDQRTLYSSPYYGYKGYGRPTKVEYY